MVGRQQEIYGHGSRVAVRTGCAANSNGVCVGCTGKSNGSGLDASASDRAAGWTRRTHATRLHFVLYLILGEALVVYPTGLPQPLQRYVPACPRDVPACPRAAPRPMSK